MLVVLSRFRWQHEALRAAELVAASGGGDVELAPAGLPLEDSASKLSPTAGESGAPERGGVLRATVVVEP